MLRQQSVHVRGGHESVRLGHMLYRSALLVSRVIGTVVGTALVVMIFYTILTPTALLMRLCGSDSLSLRTRDARSYWVARKKQGREHMKHPY
jgi:hypothetical protein